MRGERRRVSRIEAGRGAPAATNVGRMGRRERAGSDGEVGPLQRRRQARAGGSRSPPAGSDGDCPAPLSRDCGSRAGGSRIPPAPPWTGRRLRSPFDDRGPRSPRPTGCVRARRRISGPCSPKRPELVTPCTHLAVLSARLYVRRRRFTRSRPARHGLLSSRRTRSSCCPTDYRRRLRRNHDPAAAAAAWRSAIDLLRHLALVLGRRRLTALASTSRDAPRDPRPRPPIAHAWPHSFGRLRDVLATSGCAVAAIAHTAIETMRTIGLRPRRRRHGARGKPTPPHEKPSSASPGPRHRHRHARNAATQRQLGITDPLGSLAHALLIASGSRRRAPADIALVVRGGRLHSRCTPPPSRPRQVGTQQRRSLAVDAETSAVRTVERLLYFWSADRPRTFGRWSRVRDVRAATDSTRRAPTRDAGLDGVRRRCSVAPRQIWLPTAPRMTAGVSSTRASLVRPRARGARFASADARAPTAGRSERRFCRLSSTGRRAGWRAYVLAELALVPARHTVDPRRKSVAFLRLAPSAAWRRLRDYLCCRDDRRCRTARRHRRALPPPPRPDALDRPWTIAAAEWR